MATPTKQILAGNYSFTWGASSGQATIDIKTPPSIGINLTKEKQAYSITLNPTSPSNQKADFIGQCTITFPPPKMTHSAQGFMREATRLYPYRHLEIQILDPFASGAAPSLIICLNSSEKH